MATKRAEAAARAQVERALGVPLPDAVWNRHDHVLVQRLTDETGGERRTALRDLIAQARTDLDDYIAPYLAAVGGKRSPGGSSPPDVDRSVSVVERQTLGAYEENRGRAFSEGIARLAGDPAGENGRAVHAFRRVALGGRTLTAEEAFAFMRSPAVAALTVEDFARIGASPVEHSARIEDRTSGVEDSDWGLREFERFTVVIEPPGTRVPWSLGWSPNHRKDVRGRIELPVEASGDDLRLGTIAYWNLWGQRTVLGELHRLAKRLAKYYPWEEWQAAWFLLTGQPTWISPLTTRTEVRHGDGWDRGTVTMTMDLWVPAATVERIYRHVQHQRRQGAARRRDKALAVWLFTEDMERTAGRRLTTPELMRAWNEAHPDDRRADRSSFHDLRKRGEEAAARLLRPGDQMVIAPRATSATEATPVSTPKPADVSE